MKLELKENMYVRTKDGIIDKVTIDYNGHCASPICECKHISCAKNYYDEDKIIKASYNIIDILEVGDYVNGYKVTGIGGTYHGRKDRAIYCDYQENEKTGKWIMIYDDEIKSIVTHEQMEQMAYKIGD